MAACIVVVRHGVCALLSLSLCYVVCMSITSCQSCGVAVAGGMLRLLIYCKTSLTRLHRGLPGAFVLCLQLVQSIREYPNYNGASCMAMVR